MGKLVFGVCVQLLALLWCCSGAEYYVEPGGTDLPAPFAGSSGNPWGSLAFAMAQTVAGDKVHMAGGLYPDKVLNVNHTIELVGTPGSYAMLEGVLVGDPVYTTWKGVRISWLNITGVRGGVPAGYNDGMMFKIGPGFTFDDVIFDHVSFWLTADIDPAIKSSLIAWSTVTIPLASSTGVGVIFRSCYFHTGSFANEGGNVFGIHVTGGPLTFDSVYVEGYDPKWNQSAQINTASPVTLTVKNSVTRRGGNFYICRASGYEVFDNTFYNAAFGIDGCRNGDIYNNKFVDTGTHPVYAPPWVPDPWAHAGCIGILSVSGFPDGVQGLTIRDNHFSGHMSDSAILVNRWKNPPTPETFQGISFSRNDFSEVQDPNSYAINLNFSGVSIDASHNYWGPNGPNGRVRGEVSTEPYYTDADMKHLDSDPTPAASSDDKSYVGLIVGLTLGAAVVFFILGLMLGLAAVTVLALGGVFKTHTSTKKSIRAGLRDYGGTQWAAVPVSDAGAAEAAVPSGPE